MENNDIKMTERITVVFLARANLEHDNSLAVIGSGESFGDWSLKTAVYGHLTSPISREWVVKMEIERDLELFWSWIVINSHGHMIRRESKPRRRLVRLGRENIIIRADYNGPTELLSVTYKVPPSITPTFGKQGHKVNDALQVGSLRDLLNGAGDCRVNNDQPQEIKVNYTQKKIEVQTYGNCIHQYSSPVYSQQKKTDYEFKPNPNQLSTHNGVALVTNTPDRPLWQKCNIHSMVVNQLTAASRISGVIRFPPSSDLWNIDLSSRGRASIAVGNDTPIGCSSLHAKDTENESRMANTHQTRGFVGFFRRAVSTLANVSALFK